MRFVTRTDISEAYDQYELHHVLGPATRSLANLAEMADATSDGWGDWQQPVHAAGRLIELIWRDGTSRYRNDDVRADATVDEYKRALTPVKTFRTKAVREHGAGSQFEIIEPGAGVGGEVWAAEIAYQDARTAHERCRLREQAARELLHLAANALNEAQQRDDALGVLGELTAMRDAARLDPDELTAVTRGDELDELVELATPGTALWLLPSFQVNGATGYDGFGQPAISLGMTTPSGLVVISATGHDQPGTWLRLYPSVALTVAEARDRYWIVDAQAVNLVSGGHRDHERMVQLRDEKFPGCQVQQGRDFIPEGAHHVLAL